MQKAAVHGKYREGLHERTDTAEAAQQHENEIADGERQGQGTDCGDPGSNFQTGSQDCKDRQLSGEELLPGSGDQRKEKDVSSQLGDIEDSVKYAGIYKFQRKGSFGCLLFCI